MVWWLQRRMSFLGDICRNIYEWNVKISALSIGLANRDYIWQEDNKGVYIDEVYEYPLYC